MPDKKHAIYETSKIDNKEYCRTNGQFTRHLRNNNITYQQYYEKYITGVEEICPHCGKPKAFYQKDHTYGKTCGRHDCVGKEIAKTKSEWSDEEKLADSVNKKLANKSRSKEQICKAWEKRKKTNLEKYGVEYSTQSKNNKDKSKITKLEKYGNEFYAGWEKSAEKNRNKSAEDKNIINNKRRVTNKDRFGVEHVFLRPESVAKSRKSNSQGKDYILPSGKVVGVRGYENLALDRLFLNGYKEEDLVIHNKLEEYKLPVFTYVNENEHKSLYYPDIYIPKENLIIEVKSQWWWDGHGEEKYKGRLINNQRKAASVRSAGYNYQVWLYNDKKECEIINHD